MLGENLKFDVLIRDAREIEGRTRYEAALASEDGQTIYLYEGQLKEVPDGKLRVGQLYSLELRPFVNNRWLELKVASIVPQVEK